MTTLTTDTFFDGAIRVQQFQSGYRFSIDAFILASHVQPRPGDTLLDLGTGCGIVPLIIARRHGAVQITGVEVQADLSDLAIKNVILNDMQDRVRILRMNLKDLHPSHLPAQVQWVVSNPPYRKADSGRLNPNRQKAVARHEVKATLLDIVQAAHRVLSSGGKFLSIYPAERMVEFMATMHSAGIEPKRLRAVHSSRETDAKLVLFEGVKGAHPGSSMAPPLFVYNEDGSYSQEVVKMFEL